MDYSSSIREVEENADTTDGGVGISDNHSVQDAVGDAGVSDGGVGISANQIDTTDYNQYCRNGRQDYISGLLRDILGDVTLRCLPPNQRILRQQISKYQLDFLIFADLGMDFATYALAHSRLARFQVIVLFIYTLLSILYYTLSILYPFTRSITAGELYCTLD